MNIAFYVSGNAGRLRKIINEGYEDLLHDTKLIFSDDSSNSGLVESVQGLDILYHCLNYKEIANLTLTKNMQLSNELLGLLKELKIDYCFSFGGHILVGDIISEYENKIINFHPSILPMYPGRLSIDAAVSEKSNLLGSTAHFIDAGIDTGPIIMQNVISSKVFSKNNYDIVLDNQIPMLYQIYTWLKSDRISVTDRKVDIRNADYGTSAFYPGIENE